MRHCCNFNPEDIYYLQENILFTDRRLSIGTCPVCNKRVAELVGKQFDGTYVRKALTGLRAERMIQGLRDEIVYSLRDYNFSKFKSKPYGWKYGVNKVSKIKGKEVIKQYAYDFYGNSELIKTV